MTIEAKIEKSAERRVNKRARMAEHENDSITKADVTTNPAKLEFDSNI